MIRPQALLADLRRELRFLVKDIAGQVEVDLKIDAELRAEHADAQRRGRTATAYEVWRGEQVTQAAVAWLLSCLFVRFVEDNDLVAERFLAGRGAGLRTARDTQTAYFLADRKGERTDREYLRHAFRTVAAERGMDDLFDEEHNMAFRLPVSADGASRLLTFWRRQHDTADGAVPDLAHDFHDPDLDTRFLGDLYQDLSEDARKRYALLQTPEFVERFILDRTLKPAIATFGIEDTNVIDPACGSGHFLLGAFDMLLEHWERADSGVPVNRLVARALEQIAGVDANPFAVAIARFRLLVAALKACGAAQLRDTWDFKTYVAVGDSLLHSVQDPLPGLEDHLSHHTYYTEDYELLEAILGSDRRYAAVVGNPPYITVKDKAMNQAYRRRYKQACHRQYALASPFLQRFFELARPGSNGEPAGFVGQITTNSFMKRESGKKLIEQVLPTLDLTVIADTSQAIIPGHGTSTVILFGRNQRPRESTVRMVRGIRGEPSKPADPSRGVVWQAIVNQIDYPGSESGYVSVDETPRSQLAEHPWSIGGGGAAELKDRLDAGGPALKTMITEIGRTTHTGEDHVYFMEMSAARARGFVTAVVPLIRGDLVRDYALAMTEASLFPYDHDSGEPVPPAIESLKRHYWTYRTPLRSRLDYGRTPEERGLEWWSHSMFFARRYRTPLSIAFAFVATHNHFVLDRGRKVFNRTAPAIQLAEEASEDLHLFLLGLLNSSVACFWLKQVCFNKGVGGVGGGIGDESWEPRYEFDATKLKQFPVVAGDVVGHARALDRLAREAAEQMPAALCRRTTPTRAGLDAARKTWEDIRARQVAVQEELDWRCLHAYDVVDEDLTVSLDQVPPLALGERAFEVVLARRMDAGEEESAWFDRHRSKSITDLPDHWPESYRRLVERRVELIADDRDVGLVERPEHKRRWATEPWERQKQAALRDWLLDRLESRELWYAATGPCIRSMAQLTDRLRDDHGVMDVLALYAGTSTDPAVVVEELVLSAAVPAVAAARYTQTGLDKRGVWERTWEMQRHQDSGKTVYIPVPPKYTKADFRSDVYWQARGKLDVPKERFILYPEAGRDADRSPVVGWAGWDHLEQVTAVAGYALERQADGWDAVRLTPLLAAWHELVPWVRQWHDDVDKRTGRRIGTFFADHLAALLSELQLTVDDLRSWEPAGPARRLRGARRRISTGSGTPTTVATENRSDRLSGGLAP